MRPNWLAGVWASLCDWLTRASEAVAALQKALELDPPREREILAKLAPLYSEDLVLDEPLAAETFAGAVNLDPDSEEAREALAEAKQAIEETLK